MNKVIYITYCSKQKTRKFFGNQRKVFPSQLYTSNRIQEFIKFCEKQGYAWAIFSDLYGLVLKDEKIGWYNKPPDCVSDQEYADLIKSTISKIKCYDKIIFFYDSETFHPLYKKLVKDLCKYKSVVVIDKLESVNEE